MKRLFLILLLVFPLSCYDGLSDMLDEVTMKAPICVWDAAPGPVHDGRGWGNAYLTLADAVAAVDEGETIWVAGSQNLTATVTISKALTILGGFSGVESRRDQRDVNSRAVVNYLSTDSGAIFISSQDVVFDTFRIENLDSENGAVTITDGSSAVFENCHFYDNKAGVGNGAAINLYNAGVQIRNCIFDNNRISVAGLNGGAISAENDSVITIDRTEFYNNSVQDSYGGAIALDSSTLTIRGGIFGDKNDSGSGNKGFYGGGAIYAINSSSVFISENTVFYRNNAAAGGAIYVNKSNLDIKDVFFGNKDTAGSQNTAGTGVAVYAVNESVVTIESSEFYRHTAGNQGGAIYTNFSSIAISRSKFGDKDTVDSGNTASEGGAIYVINSKVDGKGLTIFDNTEFYRNSGSSTGGAISAEGSTVTITGSLFGDEFTEGNGNSANYGGSIYAITGTVLSISNKTNFYRNNANEGGAIYSEGSSVTISGSSFGSEFTANSGNTANYGGGAIRSVSSSILTITGDSKFFRNQVTTTGRGGAIDLNASNLTIEGSQFGGTTENSGNLAITGGGAVSTHLSGGSSIVYISDSIFIGNSGGQDGGAIRNYQCDLHINSCIFSKNVAVGNDGGGAVYLWHETNEFSIVNSYFYDNKVTGVSSLGGALRIYQTADNNLGAYILANLTFYSNSAANAGAIHFSSNQSGESRHNYRVYNSVFYENVATAGGSLSDNIHSDVSYDLYNCYFNGGMVVDTGLLDSGNKHSCKEYPDDPFASTNPGASNFLHPATNLGINGLIDNGILSFAGFPASFTMPLTDLAGNNREVGTIDIGAYERQ